MTSDNRLEDIKELIRNSRYLAAKELWDQVTTRPNALDNTIPTEENGITLDSLADVDRSMIEMMIKRSEELKVALSISDIDSSWTHGITYFGITTHYKLAPDGTMQFRLEGVLENLPIFEQCAVIHEIDLFKEWIPFCSDSIMIDKIGNAELIAYVYINVIAASRDTLVRAYGADCLQEQAKIVVIGESVPSWDPQSVHPSLKESSSGRTMVAKSVPFRNRRWTHDRVDIHDLAAIIHVLSPNTAKTIITARVDLHSSLPQSIINFVVKNVAGVGLYLFQQQALKVSKNPDCSHNHRIRENKEFYMDWVYPKLRDFCTSKGWDVPTVAALDNNTTETG